MVPAPLSVAPDLPSQESKCAESRMYSVRQLLAPHLCDDVVDRLLGQELGVGPDLEHRVLVAQRQARYQAVVLA